MSPISNETYNVTHPFVTMCTALGRLLPSVYRLTLLVDVRKRCQPCWWTNQHPRPNNRIAFQRNERERVFSTKSKLYLGHVDIASADTATHVQNNLIILQIERFNEFLNISSFLFTCEVRSLHARNQW